MHRFALLVAISLAACAGQPQLPVIAAEPTMCVTLIARVTFKAITRIEFTRMNNCSHHVEYFDLAVDTSWKEALCLLSLPELDWIYEDAEFFEVNGGTLPYVVSRAYDPANPQTILTLIQGGDPLREDDWTPTRVSEVIRSPPASRTDPQVCRDAARRSPAP